MTDKIPSDDPQSVKQKGSLFAKAQKLVFGGDASKQKISKLISQNDQLEKMIAQLYEEKTVANNEKEVALQEKFAVEKKNKGLVQWLVAVSKEKEELSSQNAKIKKQKNALEEEMGFAENELEDVLAKNAELTKKLDDKTQKLGEEQQKSASQERELVNIEEELSWAHTKIAVLTDDLDDTKKKLDESEALNAKLAIENNSLKDEMTAMRLSNLELRHRLDPHKTRLLKLMLKPNMQWSSDFFATNDRNGTNFKWELVVFNCYGTTMLRLFKWSSVEMCASIKYDLLGEQRELGVGLFSSVQGCYLDVPLMPQSEFEQKTSGKTTIETFVELSIHEFS